MIFVVFFTLILLASCSNNAGQNEKKKKNSARPNIIYIMADDLTTQAISAYENGIYDDIAPTPNMDRLAREGTLFNRAYCQQAVCNPSRASLMTSSRAKG